MTTALEKKKPQAATGGSLDNQILDNGNDTPAREHVNPSVLKPLLDRACRSHHWAAYRHLRAPLTDAKVEAHLNGGDPVGVCFIAPGENTTRAALLDLDSHRGETPWLRMLEAARAISGAMAAHGLKPIPFRSSGGNGLHLLCLWRDRQCAYTVRELLKRVLAECGLENGTKGIAAKCVEVFPKQAAVGVDNFGSMAVLPLANKSCALRNDTLEDTTPDRIKWEASRPVAVVEREAASQTNAPVPAELAVVKSALDAIPNRGELDGNYDKWFSLCCAVHSASGGSDEGLALFDEFSARSCLHEPDFLAQRVWPYIRDDREGPRTTVRTLFAQAESHGWQNPSVVDDFAVIEPATVAPVGGRFVSAKDFAAMKSPPWIVKNVLPQAEVGMIFGASGSGKTFFAFDLVAAIARGVEWCGNRVVPGKVGYVCAEGAGGFRNRVRAYMSKHELKTLDLDVLPDSPNFLQPGEINRLLGDIRACGPLSVVVVDTLASVMPGGDENSGKDTGAVIANCKRIHRETGAMVLIVHHSGKNPDKGARGWSGTKAAVDVEIEVSRFENDREALVSKLKDGEDGVRYGFRLQTVPVDVDEDGDAITSCIVEHTGLQTKTKRRQREAKGAAQKLVQRAVLDLMQLGGDDVTVTAVLDRAVGQMPFDNGQGKRDQRRATALRALESLAACEILQVAGGIVTVAGE